jgi:hypothetical protein
MKLTLPRWTFWWGSIGLLIPVALILRCRFLSVTFGQIDLILWPSSILLLMGLEGQPSAFIVILSYAMAIMANISVYCVIGLLMWPVLRLVLRRRRLI